MYGDVHRIAAISNYFKFLAPRRAAVLTETLTVLKVKLRRRRC